MLCFARSWSSVFWQVLFCAFLGTHVHAVVVIEHLGDKDPTTEGWVHRQGVNAGAISSQLGVPETGSGGVAAWRVGKRSTKVDSVHCYHGGEERLSAHLQQAVDQGWRLTARVQVQTASGMHAQNVEFGTRERRYVITFGMAKTGDPVVYFMGGHPSRVVLEGYDSGFHTYQLTSAPGTNVAHLLVDGKPVGGPFTGVTAGPYGGRLIFGNNASEAWGTADYALVRLEVAPDVDAWPSWERADVPVIPRVLSVRRIWDRAPHNAFTDLVRWRDRFYCAFREGEGHAGDIGKLRVIGSADGTEWKSVGVLEMDGFDLRDADLSVTPDDRLMVLGGAQKVIDGEHLTGTFVSFSTDGNVFAKPKIVVPLGRWLWRVTWHNQKAYGVDYATHDGKPFSSLLVSENGADFEKLVPQLLGEGGWPTEAVLRFDPDETCYCLHRRDGRGNTAFLGRAKPPFKNWQWFDLGQRLGGPNMLQIPGRHWIGAGRLYDGGAHTALVYLDVENAIMTPLCRLPSGGDTSYPGLVWHAGKLFMSYYSSHEARTSIYFAEIEFTPRGRKLNEPFRAIPKYCAWPNLTRLPDGSIIATVFNQPSHGAVPGDAECWASDDEGWTWKYRGTPARHEGSSNRMNVAAGLANNGDLIVLCSGWSNPGGKDNRVLPPWVCRSRDAGKTWTVEDSFPLSPQGASYIPFGNIDQAEDGSLRVCCYLATGNSSGAAMLASTDDGKTWKLLSQIDVDHNETAPLHLGSGHWLAAARSKDSFPNEATDLFGSSDDGVSWTMRTRVGQPGQHPAHLMRLRDGRVLASYGDRRSGHLGVECRFSSDQGETWAPPVRIVDAPDATWNEIGYPASLQRSDGRILTVYYVRTEAEGYSMSGIVWDPASR